MRIARCKGIWAAVMTIFLAASAQAAAGTKVVGYFAGWNGARGYTADKIPAEKLSHVNYAFAVIVDGECAVKDKTGAAANFRELAALKQKHPHLRTLISVGGWGGSGEFSDSALTQPTREKFAQSCALFAHENGFDGVDIDWEYPGGGGAEKGKGRPEDTKNFTLLLAELRRQLDAAGEHDGKHYLLTIAAPAGGQAKRIELAKIQPLLDFINLMTYDFAGPWDAKTGFNSPLFSPKDAADRYNAAGAVQSYLDAGVPPDKLVMGVPFYGRAWTGVKDVDRGLFQPHSGKPAKATGSGDEWTYRSIAEHYVGKTGTRFWHEQAKVPWIYDAKTQLMVSYDDPESLKAKADFVRAHHLGGVMIWELSQDDERGSLLNALHEGLAGK
jgi:chitinase